MATFIVVPTDSLNTDALAEKMSAFGNNSYRLPNGEWLASYHGTSRQLYEQIGIENGIIVLNFFGYWGMASQDIWEWIATYQQQKS